MEVGRTAIVRAGGTTAGTSGKAVDRLCVCGGCFVFGDRRMAECELMTGDVSIKHGTGASHESEMSGKALRFRGPEGALQ